MISDLVGKMILLTSNRILFSLWKSFSKMRIIKIPLMVMLIAFKLSSQQMHDARNAMPLSVKDSIVHLYKVNDYDASNAYGTSYF